MFAYSVETACDKHGWILGYTVHPGNEHDSRTWKPLYDKLKGLGMEMSMTNTMTVICVQQTKFLHIEQRTGKVAKNTKVIKKSVRPALIFPDVPRAKNMKK